MDMHGSPEGVPLLEKAGWSAVHWSPFGDPAADDQAVLGLVLKNRHVVLTHDLDSVRHWHQPMLVVPV